MNKEDEVTPVTVSSGKVLNWFVFFSIVGLGSTVTLKSSESIWEVLLIIAEQSIDREKILRKKIDISAILNTCFINIFSPATFFYLHSIFLKKKKKSITNTESFNRI